MESHQTFLQTSPEQAAVFESPLLRTKLYVPLRPPFLLSRPRLTSRFPSQLARHVTLLSAPAGYGKTTLVVDWVAQQQAPVAWLTLDEQDNDPILFWRYLISALQTVYPQLGLKSRSNLEAITQVNIEAIVALLINDIVSLVPTEDTLLLVLDDLHWIHNAAVHQGLGFLLHHQPAQLQLILLTRADPSLPLARLRVEERLTELRSADLRLTSEEIEALLNGVLGLQLPAEALGQLMEQTEGWAAGLQLASLSLRRREPDDAVLLLQSSARVRQHVFDYLMEEVLRHQPAETRGFLQRTAVLRQFCAPLCSAVTGLQNSDELLHRLAAESLFIIPLDDEGLWYRYHPLFAEMLRANLDEAEQHEGHRRAALWYASRLYLQDAMRNALAAQDYDLMASLLTQSYKTFLTSGLLVSLQKWLKALPDNYLSPRLRLASAWCRVYESNEQELDEIVAELLGPRAEPDAPFEGEVLAVQSIYASLYGRTDRAIGLATKALQLIDPEDHLSLAAAYQALGNAHRFECELDAAIAAYDLARKEFKAMGNVFMSQLPSYRIAHVQIMQGRLHLALQTYETVRQKAQDAGSEPLIASGEVFGHLSGLYREWNELDRAADYARREIELARSGNMLLALVDGYLKLAAVTAAQGESEATREVLNLAAAAAQQLRSESVSARVAMHLARHELIWGNVAVAASWADEYVAVQGSDACRMTPMIAQSADLLLARIRLAQGQPELVLGQLEDLKPRLETTGRMRLIVEANLLQAMAMSAMGEETAARKGIIRSLALANQEGYLRLFVGYGPELVPLLNQARHLFPEYVSRILTAMPIARPLRQAKTPLLGELTEREAEILNLIAQGHSNRQIADALVISVGTVKGHINHIFSKLDVQNRTHALVRARDLNLIDL